MNTTKKAQQLLKRMATIQKMERGKICKMTGRNHFNHQTWQAGRNIVRYVPREEIDDLQQSIDGYTQFLELAQQYAEEIVQFTRKERTKRTKGSSQKKNPAK